MIEEPSFHLPNEIQSLKDRLDNLEKIVQELKNG